MPPQQSDKAGMMHHELERELTVQPLPAGIKIEGGLLLDTEGLSDQTSLRLAPDGRTVLLPQPTNDPNDPLNWSWSKKHLILLTVAWAALCADWTSATGSAIIFPQAADWQLSVSTVNQPNAINVLFGGIGALVWVPVSSFWGRAPVLLWTAVLGLAVSAGAAYAPNYKVFFAMRVLTMFFLTAGQTMAIALLKDMFFFHERARKIGLWAVLYIASPYLGPCLSNFILFGTGQWRDPFKLCIGIVALQVLLVLLFADETWYNRAKHLDEQPKRAPGFLGRISRLLGVWQFQHHNKYFPTVAEGTMSFFKVIVKPPVFLICVSYLLIFAWAIGINITTAILFSSPIEYGGYGYTSKSLGFLYFTPIVGVFIGEMFGHFFNDWVARRYIHKHKGLFEPEVRLWMMYISIGVMVPALVLVGQALRWHLNVAAVIFGWGGHSFGVMTMSVAVTAYGLDSYPMIPAELGGWLNVARTIGGFSIGFLQSPWVEAVGADASFGTQAAFVALAAVPVLILQFYGRRLRMRAP